MTTWKFTFGKHRDKEITDTSVPNGYIEWLLGDNDDGEPRLKSERFREALSGELERRKSSGPARPRTPNPSGGNWSGNDRLSVAVSTQLAEVLVRLQRIENALGTPVTESPVVEHVTHGVTTDGEFMF